MATTPVFLLEKFHRQTNLVGCSPWCHKRVQHDLVTKQQQQPITCRGISLTKFLSVVALDDRPTEGKALENQVVNAFDHYNGNDDKGCGARLFETALDCYGEKMTSTGL